MFAFKLWIGVFAQKKTSWDFAICWWCVIPQGTKNIPPLSPLGKRNCIVAWLPYPKSDTRISVLRPPPPPPPSRSYYPPWILKRAGLESSGRRLISSIGKTMGIAFFFFFGNIIFFFKPKTIYFFQKNQFLRKK